ncbi:hypothetical protein DM02DRAFT_92042 [Periconia macrospinosa]|uniref:Uncharacterized protein n=1 Tax=Periconia macrospinosa TaxID=97972 RepID=A0A2V1DIR0_9PLEO|nr:hypothetical protein DM02DRAFT_92042 [Periconia macrospinosa]
MKRSVTAVTGSQYAFSICLPKLTGSHKLEARMSEEFSPLFAMAGGLWGAHDQRFGLLKRCIRAYQTTVPPIECNMVWAWGLKAVVRPITSSHIATRGIIRGSGHAQVRSINCSSRANDGSYWVSNVGEEIETITCATRYDPSPHAARRLRSRGYCSRFNFEARHSCMGKQYCSRRQSREKRAAVSRSHGQSASRSPAQGLLH